MKPIEVWIDGSCVQGHMNPISCGVVIKLPDGSKKFLQAKQKDGSNNAAEYLALCTALKWLIENGYNHQAVIVRSDSMLVVRQMTGEWKVTRGKYLENYYCASELAKKFGHITFEWIPRCLNTEADQLSKQK